MKAPLAKTSRGLLASRAGRWTFAGLVALALVLLVLGRIEHPAVDRARVAATDLASPVLDVLSRPLARLDAGWEWVGSLGDLAERNQALREENAQLRRWQAAALALERENNRLRELLELPEIPAEPIASARVLAVPGGPFVRSVVINVGRRQGVRRDQPVFDGNGLVGRVLEAGALSSRVLLVTDLNSRVPVRIPTSEVTAIARGRNDDLLELAFLGPEAEVAPGDHVVTTGDGGVFPPGISVGRVQSVTSERVTVRPAALLDRLEFVRVIAAVKDALAVDGANGESVPATTSSETVLEGGR